MLVKTKFSINVNLLEEAAKQIPDDEFRVPLNVPTGNFFYDPWNLKQEFIGTVWEKIYNSLSVPKGEARIIKLNGGEAYISHADIDDRYHLNISGFKSYLIDLDNDVMHETIPDGIWYNMDAGRRHTAVNFGNRIRYQLVIRHLLTNTEIKNPIKVVIRSRCNIDKDDARFIFDDRVSPWLNSANKLGIINNFSYVDNIINFNISENVLESFKEILPKEFILE